MSQQNDKNRDRQQQGEGYQDANDQSTRESRGESETSEQNQKNQPGSNQDLGSDLDEAEDIDEDRDDDLRTNGGPNRRGSNIG